MASKSKYIMKKKERRQKVKDLFNLKGKKVIITGGAAGLGRSIIEGMHDAGAEVAIIDIADNVYEAANEIQGNGAKAYGIKADLGNKESLERGFNEAIEKLGGYLDVLVNNAGVQRRCPVIDFPQEDWDFVIKLNLTQVFQMSQLAGKIMIKRGYGKIINIASMNTFITVKNISAYAASKGAIGQFTKSLANEWAGYGININALAPGFITTPMTVSLKDTPDRLKLLDRIPAGRWGLPEDLVGTAIYLASSASDYVNGAIIPIDGGFLAN